MLSLSLLAACLAVPPAVEPGRAFEPAPVDPSTSSTASQPSPPKPAAEPLSRSVPDCPLVTGKHRACTHGLLCRKDAKGCEVCECKEDFDPDGRTVEPLGLDPREK